MNGNDLKSFALLAEFTEEEMEAMLEGFEFAREWAARAANPAPVESEARAASLLARSLRAASEDSWSSAVADLELLFEGYRDTLLVRMLSDGRPWQTLPEYEAEPQTPEGTGGPGGGGGDGGQAGEDDSSR